MYDSSPVPGAQLDIAMTPDDSFRQKFAALLDTPFSLGDGREVVWGKATVKDHSDRIAFLSKMRNGIDATIARHQEAIAVIQAAKARCLNDAYKGRAA